MSHRHLAWSTCRKILGCFQRWLLKASCRPRTSKDLPLLRSGNHFLNSATIVSSGICFSQGATMIRKLLIQLPAPKLCLACSIHTHKTNALHLTTSAPTKLVTKQRCLCLHCPRGVKYSTDTCQQNQKYSPCLTFIF